MADFQISSQHPPEEADRSVAKDQARSRRYAAFVSYSHADARWARWLMRRLENYRVPERLQGRVAPVGIVGARLGHIFRDRDELPTTNDLGGTIRAALAESATLVVICSPSAARSPWVGKEIAMFKLLHGDKNVFAFIVAGEPKVAGAADDCFPTALRTTISADGLSTPEGVEVVGADARAQGDGPGAAFVRLLSGMLGVGFDDLRQRELQRRNQRLRMIVAACTVGMAAALALAVTAWRARTEALLARNDAQRRQQQAEDVLTFMVGDFRTELKKLGRLSLLDAVGDKATAYFDTLDPRDLSENSLVSQTRALTQIGENRMDQARYTEAAHAFATAHARAAAMAAHQPRNGDALFWRAQAEYWVGFVQWKRGNLAQAEEWLTRYRDTAKVLAGIVPSKEAWQGELAYGYHNLAVLDRERGKFDAAREGFVTELATLTRMSVAQPDNLELQFRLTDVESWLGSLAEQSGNFSGAEGYFAAQVQGLEKLVQADPTNTRWKVKLADALSFSSNLRAITARTGEALNLRRQARALIDPLVAQDPGNHSWLVASLSQRLREAVLLEAQGKFDEAEMLASAARQGFEKLHAKEPSARTLTADLSIAWGLEAELRDRAGNPDAAGAADQAVALGKSLLLVDPNNVNYVGDFVKVALIAGLIESRRGDHAGATIIWEDAIAAAHPLLSGCNYWRVLDPAARAFALVGKTEQSRSLIERLHRFGYQPLVPWP